MRKTVLTLLILVSLAVQPILTMEKSQDEINAVTAQLNKALKKNDLEQAKQLIAAGADPKCGYINFDAHLEGHIEQNNPEKNIVEIPFPPDGTLNPNLAAMHELLNQHDISIHPRSKKDQRRINGWLWDGIKDSDEDRSECTIQ